MAEGEILVTALIVTCNHAAYVGEAIDSALAQVTGFPLEILVCDDASTDRTPEIVRGYADRFPGRITVLPGERNLGANPNTARGLRAARGRFVALLDGDDFWTAPDKLERQARHLLDHPECAAHFCNARIVRGTTPTEELWTPPGQPARATLADIWQGNPYPTAGGMLRVAALGGVPEWYDRMRLTDWPLYILAATTGELHFDPVPAACYRLHEGGTFSPLDESEKLHLTDETFHLMERNFSGRFRNFSRAGRSHLFHDWALGYLARGDCSLARTAWRLSLAAGPGPGAVPLSKSLRLGWRIARRSLAA